MPAAANIDEVITFAALDIAEVSYGGVDSLLVQTNLWIAGMFSQATGIYPPSQDAQMNPGQRPVTNWYAAHVLARAEIEGPGPGQSGVVGTSSVINAVVRVASAVKFATINGFVTTAQQTAVVTLYNAVWA